MSVIATETEPHGVTRIFFDCVPADPDPRERVRVARAIEQSEAAAAAELQVPPPRRLTHRLAAALARGAAILTIRACPSAQRAQRTT
jgi:hypothetical protein